MKILITGASGLLGRQLYKTLLEADFEVTGLYFTRKCLGLVQHDLTDMESTQQLIKRIRPDLVVHSAAQRFPDKIETDPERSKNLNVSATETLTQVTEEIGGRLIYISTDYVFDGEKAPYSFDAETNPTNKYGQLKLDGENAVKRVRSHIILRVPILYGEIEDLQESALTCLLNTVRDGKKCKVSSYEVRCPAHTKDVANIVLDLAKRLPNVEGGVYQWSGLEKMSKWDIVTMIGKELNFSVDHVEEVITATVAAVPRPRDVEMDRSRLTDLGIRHHTDFKTGFLNAIKPFV